MIKLAYKTTWNDEWLPPIMKLFFFIILPIVWLFMSKSKFNFYFCDCQERPNK